MIARRYERFVLGFFISLFMSGLMSFVITIFNIGWPPNLATLWLKAWAFAFLIAFPSVLLVTPIAKRVTQSVISEY